MLSGKLSKWPSRMPADHWPAVCKRDAGLAAFTSLASLRRLRAAVSVMAHSKLQKRRSEALETPSSAEANEAHRTRLVPSAIEWPLFLGENLNNFKI